MIFRYIILKKFRSTGQAMTWQIDLKFQCVMFLFLNNNPMVFIFENIKLCLVFHNILSFSLSLDLWVQICISWIEILTVLWCYLCFYLDNDPSNEVRYNFTLAKEGMTWGNLWCREMEPWNDKEVYGKGVSPH